MKKKKEYIIAGSLLSLAIVGMVFAYNTESGDKKSQEKEEQQVAFQEVEKDKETAKDEVEDVSSILKAKEKNIPITNYGITIAYLKEILARTLEIFEEK